MIEELEAASWAPEQHEGDRETHYKLDCTGELSFALPHLDLRQIKGVLGGLKRLDDKDVQRHQYHKHHYQYGVEYVVVQDPAFSIDVDVDAIELVLYLNDVERVQGVAVESGWNKPRGCNQAFEPHRAYGFYADFASNGTETLDGDDND